MIKTDLRQYVIANTGLDSTKVQWEKSAKTIGIPCIALHSQDVDIRYTQDDARIYSEDVTIHIWHYDFSKCQQVCNTLAQSLLTYDKSYSENIKDIFVESIQNDDEKDESRTLYRQKITVTVWHE